MADIPEGADSGTLPPEKVSVASGIGGARPRTTSFGMSCQCNVGNVRQAINRIYKEEKNVRGLVVCCTLCGMDQEGRACVEHFRELGNLYSNLGSFDERAVSPNSSEMVMSTRGEHGDTHISKAYRSKWWAFRTVPHIIIIRIIVVMSVSRVVWTMVSSNIICVWLLHSQPRWAIINAC